MVCKEDIDKYYKLYYSDCKNDSEQNHRWIPIGVVQINIGLCQILYCTECEKAIYKPLEILSEV